MKEFQRNMMNLLQTHPQGIGKPDFSCLQQLNSMFRLQDFVTHW